MTPARLRSRAWAYNNIDGVGELGGGFFFAGAALLQWLHFHLPAHSLWNSGFMPLLYFGTMVAVIHYGSKAIKNRVTFPRTGFVEYRNRGLWRFAAASVSQAIIVGLIIAQRRHWNLTSPASLVGLLFAGSYAYGIARSVRWKWTVVAAMTLGTVVIATLPADQLVGVTNDHALPGLSATAFGAILLLFAVYGVLLLISGAITFALYLRNTPPAPPVEV